MSSRTCLLLFMTAWAPVASAAPPAACKDAQEAFKEAARLEAAHKLPEAFARLSQIQPECQTQPEHLAKLNSLLTIKAGLATGAAVMLSERARDLRSLMQKLDPVNDQSLLQESYVLLHGLETRAHSVGGSDLGELLRETKQAWRERDWGRLPLSLTQTIAAATGRFLLRTALFLIFIAFVLWRVWPRKGIQISFEDLTAKALDKPEKDRLLTQDVQQAFWVPRTELPGMESLQLDALSDHNGYGFGSLLPQRPMIPWADIVQSDSPIKVGPVAFSLKQILSLVIAPLQLRRRYSLAGFLHEQEGQMVMMAQELDWKGRTVPGCSWKVELGPGGKRENLIRELAAQIIVDLRVSRVTSNWRSYRCFERGIQHISRRDIESTGCECIQGARSEFQESLTQDPANWMARFYLGIALRRCGENELAAMQFDVLQELLKEADRQIAQVPNKARGRGRHHPPLVRHLMRYPQCPFLLLYNMAMAVSNSHRPEQLERALELLNGILTAMDTACPKEALAFPNCAARLSESDRSRFKMLARSAQTSVWAAQIEMESRKGDSSPAISKLTREIDAVASGLDVIVERLDPVLLTSHAFARAITLNAQARAHSVSCSTGSKHVDLSGAKELFTRASVILPDFADSYLNLASLYMRWKYEVCNCWPEDTERVLQTAIKLNPHNFQSYYLLSKLYAEDKVERYEEALEHLAAYRSVPEANYLMAEIYNNANYSGNDPAKAIDCWGDGVALMTDPNQAQIDHLKVLFMFARTARPESRLYRIAEEAARKLSIQGKCEADRSLGSDWSEQFDKQPTLA